MKERLRKLKNNKKVLIISIICLIGLIIGTTFAVWNYSFLGGNNTINTGDISIEFLEDNDVISLTNALPMGDNQGKESDEAFNFAVTTKANRDISVGYTLSIEKLEVDNGYTSLNDSDIKIYLTDDSNNKLVSPTKISNLSNYSLYSNTNNHSSSITSIKDMYKLRVWIDKDVNVSDWNSSTRLQYKFKINVNELSNLDKSGANAPVISENMIPVYYDEDTEVWKKADSTNESATYRWYDYDNKMWANSVTVTNNVAMDVSHNGKSGVANNIVRTDVATFNGTSSFINLPTNIGVSFPATYSVEFKTSSTNNQIIFGDYASKAALGLYNNNSRFIVSCGGTNSSVFLTGGITLNEYYKIDIVYNSMSDIQVYKNGVALSKDGTSINNWGWDDTNSYIGKRQSGNYLIGALKNFIVYDKALTSSELYINRYATPGVIGGTNGIVQNDLKLYYDFQNSSRDNLVNSNPGTPIPMSDILTMQVWIPRYKYKVWNYNLDGTVSSSPQRIDVTFEEGTAKTGEITCEDNIQGEDGDGTSEVCQYNGANCTDATCNGKTYTHPAFTFGEEEVEGIWVGKFESSSDTVCSTTSYVAIGSGCNLTTIKPLVKPDVTSWRGAMVSVFENNTMAMNDTNNIYGFASSDDTHVMKNMEWGAVAYLSHSKYGVNREVYINNSSGYYTGRSGGNVGGSTPINEIYSGQASTTEYNTYGFYTYDGYLLDYNTNTKSEIKDMSKVASTTGNIYGIYDMSGGPNEYLMANIVGPDGITMISGRSASDNYYSGYTGLLYDGSNYTSYTGTFSYPDDKYIDKYSFGTSFSQKRRNKLGDAIREVYNSSIWNWYDYSYVPNFERPWLLRGANYYDVEYAGLFFSYNTFGYAYVGNAPRIIITP